MRRPIMIVIGAITLAGFSMGLISNFRQKDLDIGQLWFSIIGIIAISLLMFRYLKNSNKQ